MAYRVWKEETTDYGRTYSGSAEKCTFRFISGADNPDLFTYTDLERWIQGVSERLEEGIAAEGGKLIKLSFYCDKGAYWLYSWRVVVIADVSGEGAWQQEAQLRSPFPWGVIIVLAIASLFGVFVLKPLIESIEKITWNVLPWAFIIGGILLLLVFGAPRKAEPKRKAA